MCHFRRSLTSLRKFPDGRDGSIVFEKAEHGEVVNMALQLIFLFSLFSCFVAALLHGSVLGRFLEHLSCWGSWDVCDDSTWVACLSAILASLLPGMPVCPSDHLSVMVFTSCRSRVDVRMLWKILMRCWPGLDLNELVAVIAAWLLMAIDAVSKNGSCLRK